ncbi:MAG: methyl-accepting chemotaxis protein [Nitrospirota bacterium]
MSFFRQMIGLLQARRAYTEKTRSADEDTPYTAEPLSESICRSWQTNLTRMADELTVISRNIEEEFLTIGNSLQALSDGYTRNSKMASSIINMVERGSEFNIDNFEGVFNKAYDNTKASADAISIGISDMKYLKDMLKEISELRSFLKDLSRSITIIGILTRIETARLEAIDFNSMTVVVDELALQIAKSTDEIASSASEAISKIIAISEKMGSRLEVFRKELNITIERLRKILNVMNMMKNKASGSCKRMESRSSQINPEIGEVVSALQYHDICRQQMDHVAEALIDIAGKIKAISEAGETEKASLKKWIGDVINIQILQLEDVITKTTTAAKGLSEHLTQISDLAEAQTVDARMILEEETGDLKIGKIITELESMLSVTSICKNMMTEMIKAVSDVSELIGRMSENVSNIVLISDSISLLALNAIIKVARTGESGGALEVLADKIRILSQQTKDEIEKGASKINSILDKSAVFRNKLSEVLNEQFASADEIGGELRSAAQGLIAAEKSLINAMTEISKITNSLKTDTSHLVGGIRFDDTVKSGAGNIIQKLKIILKEVDENISYGTEDKGFTATTNMSDLARRYTMEAEWENHKSVILSGGDGVCVPAIKDTGGNGDKSAKRDKHELGDNVELF